MQPKEVAIEVEIEKKPDESGEEAMPEESADESQVHSPEEAVAKVMQASSPEEAMKYLEDCGFELKRKESPKDESQEDEERSGGLSAIFSKMQGIKNKIAKKAAQESR